MEKKTAVMAFGRLNPPTKGHQLLVDNLEKVAKQVGGEPMLFLSHKNTRFLSAFGTFLNG